MLPTRGTGNDRPAASQMIERTYLAQFLFVAGPQDAKLGR
jgi:hypothetical protein